MLLLGRVFMDNGEAPVQPVAVKMGCDGNPRLRAYTDTRGRFSFHAITDQPMLDLDSGPGQRPGYRPPTTGEPSRTNLFGCYLAVDLPGVRSERKGLDSIVGSARIDVGTIVLHRLKGLTGHTASPTTAAAPGEAKRAHGKGIRQLRRMPPDFEKSVAHFEKAVDIYPAFAEAWAALGEARLGLDDLRGAKEALSRSIEVDAKLLGPYQPLMQMALQHSEWEALHLLSEQYLKLSPASNYTRYLAATASARMGKLDRAEALVDQLNEEGGSNRWPLIHLIMAMVYENRAQFEKAAREYEALLGASSEPKTVAMVERKLLDWRALGVIKPRENRSAEFPARP